MPRPILLGRRIHIAGSADKSTSAKLLRTSHEIVRTLVEGGIQRGAGFVVTLGEESLSMAKAGLGLTFDWTILETVLENIQVSERLWPIQQGKPIVCVGFSNWRRRIPSNRRELWRKIVASGIVELEVVRGGLNVGGVMRSIQAKSGDILLTLGGGPGVEHLAEIYTGAKKHVVALDLPLKGRRTSASERIASRTLEQPDRYFDYKPPQGAAAAYSSLTLKNSIRILEFQREFYQFVTRLSMPQAFYVRLMDRYDSAFPEVESYFRTVVDPVIQESGYVRFETGLESTSEPFLNAEIFRALSRSTIVIVDLTGLRSNCFTELGFALGASKKVVLMARKGTSLPFDANALPCYFWELGGHAASLRMKLIAFMARNVNRRSPGSEDLAGL